MSSVFVEKGDNLAELKVQSYESERQLQLLIAQNPQILGDWLLVGREVQIPGHLRIDHVYVDRTGMPVFVEVKLARNPQIKREVVGQMMEYLANATKGWAHDFLRKQFEETSQVAGTAPERVLREFIGDEDHDEFWQTVQQNLQQTQVKLAFVADAIPSQLLASIEFWNTNMPSVGVVGIEVCRYEDEKGSLNIIASKILGETSTAKENKPSLERPNSWSEALEFLKNDDVRSFFLDEITRHRHGAHRLRKLYYDCQGVRRWRILAQKYDANIYQEMRFQDDLRFWKELFPNAKMRTPAGGRQLTFNLRERSELEHFRNVVTKDCDSMKFLRRDEVGEHAPEAA